MKVLTEHGESKRRPQERNETDGWRNRKTETVFRKEYGADAKPTGDSPGAGTVVCV